MSRFIEFWKEFVRSCLPVMYKELLMRESFQARKYLNTLFVAGAVFTFILTIPALTYVGSPFINGAVAVQVDYDQAKSNSATERILTFDFGNDAPPLSDAVVSLGAQAARIQLFGMDIIVNSASLSSILFWLLAGIALLVLVVPGILLFLWLLLTVKWWLLVLLFSLAGYLMLDLTHWKLSYGKMFRVFAYAASPFVLIESILLPFKTHSFLLPIVEWGGLSLFIVTTAAYLVFAFLCGIVAARNGAKS